MNETWTEFADRIGASALGVDVASRPRRWSSRTTTSAPTSTPHVVPDAPGPEGIPLELCFGDGVVLDFRHRRLGYAITSTDIEGALARIDYRVKERDIVLIQTGAGAWNREERYRTDHCGMSGEATRYLISKGVRMMGIDAITFDPPVWAMFESGHLWEAHRVMNDEAYWHLENLTNLDQLPGHGFKLAVFPVKWIGTTAAPVRAVAILEMAEPELVWFADDACRDVTCAGGKGASLAALTGTGAAGSPRLRDPIAGARAFGRCCPGPRSFERPSRSARGGRGCRHERPSRRARTILAAYAELGEGPPVAVRSSACAEDSVAASYAGQQETFLNVRRRSRRCAGRWSSAGHRSSASGRSSTEPRRGRSTT